MSGDGKQAAGEDRDLKDLLRSTYREPPAGQVDWDRLHSGVMARVRERSTRRRTLTWWEWAAGWAERGIPVAAAAAAAIALSLGVLSPAGGGTAEAPVGIAAERLTVEDELAAGLPDSTRSLLFAGGESEFLITALMSFDPEER